MSYLNIFLVILLVVFATCCITLSYKALQSEKLSELEAAVCAFVFIFVCVVVSYQTLSFIKVNTKELKETTTTFKEYKYHFPKNYGFTRNTRSPKRYNSKHRGYKRSYFKKAS